MLCRITRNDGTCTHTHTHEHTYMTTTIPPIGPSYEYMHEIGIYVCAQNIIEVDLQRRKPYCN